MRKLAKIAIPTISKKKTTFPIGTARTDAGISENIEKTGTLGEPIGGAAPNGT
jgi:hypothetical protein